MEPAALAIRYEAAHAVIRDAGRLALDRFRQRASLPVERKGTQDLVSEADRLCEDFIVDSLAGRFPKDAFLGEEGGMRDVASDAVWVIDPIDGTHNFLTGVPFWCVSLALVVGGEIELGIIFDPNADELFAARRGGGAFAGGLRLHVSAETDVTRARICVGSSFRRPRMRHVAAIDRILAAQCEYVRLGSGALGMAYTAAGRFEAYWENHINSWDVLAGIALVREAGGWTNDFLANDGLSQGNEIFAAAPALVAPLGRLVDFAPGTAARVEVQAG